MSIVVWYQWLSFLFSYPFQAHDPLKMPPRRKVFPLTPTFLVLIVVWHPWLSFFIFLSFQGIQTLIENSTDEHCRCSWKQSGIVWEGFVIEHDYWKWKIVLGSAEPLLCCEIIIAGMQITTYPWTNDCGLSSKNIKVLNEGSFFHYVAVINNWQHHTSEITKWDCHPFPFLGDDNSVTRLHAMAR